MCIQVQVVGCFKCCVKVMGTYVMRLTFGVFLAHGHILLAIGNVRECFVLFVIIYTSVVHTIIFFLFCFVLFS